MFPNGNVDSDMFVLALPMAAGSDFLALLAFVGGLSAATAMVIVESVAVAIMVSNDLVVPLMLRRRGAATGTRADMSAFLLRARRFSIFCVLCSPISIITSPARRSSRRSGSSPSRRSRSSARLSSAACSGARRRRAERSPASPSASCVWAYTLLLPSFVAAGLIDRTILDAGPVRHRRTPAAGLVRPRSRSSDPRRAVEPLAQHRRVRLRLAVHFGDADRAAAGEHLRGDGLAFRSCRASGCGARRSPWRS